MNCLDGRLVFIASLHMSVLKIPSPLHEILTHPGLEHGIQLWMKRDDLIHPDISGNKWRKLKYNIEEARLQGAKTLISAGGPWSNHLAALAAAGSYFGFKTVGIIRGVKPVYESETLTFCRNHGMELVFLPKPLFDTLPESISQILERYPDSYFIPLGGDNEQGVRGCMELAGELSFTPDIITVSVGTGTTLKGIAKALPNVRVIGFSALRDSSQHTPDFLNWVQNHSNVQLVFQPELGGFAKTSKELNNFIISFYKHTNIVLEPVYTGKMMFGLYNMLSSDASFNNKSIISIHTGGLQGLSGYPDLHKLLFTS